MTDRSFGKSVSTFIAEVADVNDPNQSGRVKVRVIGRHDDRVNIPDSALPWAQVLQPVTSAANGRMGTAPVGLTAGSRVFGVFLDADEQLPLVMGSVGRAGDPIPGRTVGGAPAINTATGSIPASSQGIASNPYTSLYPGRVSIAAIDSRRVSVQAVDRRTGGAITTLAEANMINPRLPTVGSAPKGSDVLSVIRSVDPLGSLSALPCLNFSLLSLSSILGFLNSIVNGIANMVAQAVRSALLKLAERIGIFKLLGLLNSAIANVAAVQNLINSLNIRVCGLNLLNQGLFDNANFVMASVVNDLNTAVGSIVGGIDKVLDVTTGTILDGADTINAAANERIKSLVGSVAGAPAAAVATANTPRPNPALVAPRPPDSYVQQYYTVENDPFPGYIEWKDPSGTGAPVYTLRNNQPNFSSAQQHTLFAAQDHFTGTIGNALLSGDKLDFRTLASAVSGSVNFTEAFAVSRILGVGFSAASAIGVGAALVPTIIAAIGLTAPATALSYVTSTRTGISTGIFLKNQATMALMSLQMRVGLFTTPRLPGL
jgi:hypothetical protein